MPFATLTSSLLVRPDRRARRATSTVQNIAGRLFGARDLTSAAVMTAVGVALFVDTIILSVEAAAIWSASGLLGLQATGVLLLATLLTVPGLYLCWKVARLALDAERTPS